MYVCIIVVHVLAVYIDELLAHGSGAGDTVLTEGDDFHSGPLPIPNHVHNISFFGVRWDKIFVS